MNTVKKDPIESAIISKINEHKNEITRLEEVLKVYNYSAGGTSVVELAPPVKRKYVRNGEPIKNPKTILVPNKKQNTSNLNNVNWSHLIFSAILAKGEPMTSKEIIKYLFNGKHKSTIKVLKHRISVALTFYKNNGELKTDKNGRGLKYGLPSMFK